MATVKLPILITGKDQSSRAFRSVQGNLRVTQSAVSGLTRLLAPLAAAFSVGALGSNLIRTNKEFQSLKASLITFTGSIEAADRQFKILTDFAKTTPFALQDVVNAFNVLVSRGIKPSEDQLRSFADVSGGVGKSFTQFAEAVADAAVGEFERLKEFGIRATKQNDEVSLSFDDLTLTVENDSASITAALKEIADAKFAGGAARQAATLGGAFTNLSDSTQDFLFQIGEAGLSKEIARVVRRITEFTNGNNKLARNISTVLVRAIRTFERSIQFVIDNVELLKNALFATFSFFLINKIFNVTKGIVAFTRQLVKVQFVATALRQLFSKKGALVSGLLALALASEEARAELARQVEETLNAIKSNETLSASLKFANDIFDDFADTIGLNTDAFKDLQKEFEGMDDESNNLNVTTQKVVSQIDLLTQQTKKLNPEIFTARTAFSDLETKQKNLEKALDAGIITQKEYADAIKRIRSETIDLKAAQDQTYSSGAIKGVKDYFESISDNARNAQEFVTSAFQSLQNTLSDFFMTGKLNFSTFTDAIKRGLADLAAKAVITTGINFLGTIFPSLKFAQGGLVPGPGSPTGDDILARLSAGEYVIKASTVNKFGRGFFDKVNQGQVPSSLPQGRVDANTPGFLFGGFNPFKPITDIINKIIDPIADVIDSVIDSVGDIIGGITDSLKNLAGSILGKDLGKFLPLMMAFVLPGIGAAISANLAAGATFSSAVASGISTSFATGIFGAANMSAIATSVLTSIATSALQDGLSGAIATGILGVSGGMAMSTGMFDQSRSDAFEKLFNNSKGFLARQTGGPVSRGDAVRVGEQGPEIFLPERNGSVAPIKQGGAELIVAVNEVRDELVDLRRQFQRALAGGSLAGART